MPKTGLEVEVLEVTNTLFVNTIVVSNSLSVGSNVTINSTMITLKTDSSNVTINTNSIDTGNTHLQAVTNAPTAVVNGYVYKTLYSEVVNVQIFTANGVWQRPAWANTGKELIVVNMWGAGSASGGGGAFVYGYSNGSLPSQIVNATGTFCNVIVGSGGNTSTNTSRTSEFYYTNTRVLRAYGGAQDYGGGGGWLSYSVYLGNGGAPGGGGYNNPTNTYSSGFGGGGGGFYSNAGGRSIYGGGGGGGSVGGQGPAYYGGSSVFGGGGWGQYTQGISFMGGNGGNNTTLPEAPGGGGNNTVGGARGEVRVFTLRYVPL